MIERQNDWLKGGIKKVKKDNLFNVIPTDEDHNWLSLSIINSARVNKDVILDMIVLSLSSLSISRVDKDMILGMVVLSSSSSSITNVEKVVLSNKDESFSSSENVISKKVKFVIKLSDPECPACELVFQIDPSSTQVLLMSMSYHHTVCKEYVGLQIALNTVDCKNRKINV